MMSGTGPARQQVLKYELEAVDKGRLELEVPLDVGARVLVLVIPESDDRARELQAAASSSLGFWDNPIDDEVWNDA